jgi:hypothetical protein
MSPFGEVGVHPLDAVDVVRHQKAPLADGLRDTGCVAGARSA